MESVQLKINEHMTSVGEEILCVLDKQQRGADVCCVKLDVRVFVLERLSAAAEFMCNLFQREIETLETQLEKHNKLLDIDFDMDLDLHTADQCVETVESSLQVKIRYKQEPEDHHKQEPEDHLKQEPEDNLDLNFLHIPVCREQAPPEEEWSSSLVQEEPQPPQIKEEQEELLQRPEEAGGSMLTLPAMKSEADDESRESEPVASTSTEHMKTQADVDDCGTSQPTSDDQLLSSHCSDSDTEDSDEWEENRGDQSALNTMKSHKTQHVGGQGKLSQDLKSSEQTHSTRSHTGKKGFSCTECGKVFNVKARLKSHAMIHTGEKPFSCTVCGKGFSRAFSLKTHMMTHTGEKPYTCTVCGKGCLTTSHLKKHTSSHTGEKPLSCTVCGIGLVSASHLKIHMRTHTGEKPFSCTVCGKGFAHMGNLKTHMRTHTGSKP